MTCGGSFPSDRLACLPAATTASSTASRGTEEASTPSEIQSVSRPPAVTTPFCVIERDLAGRRAEHHGTTRHEDQFRLSGIGPRAGPTAALEHSGQQGYVHGSIGQLIGPHGSRAP